MKSLRAGQQRRRAEEELQKVQAELANASRLTTMAQIAASIAHEINQPLTSILTSGNAASRWLQHSPPNLAEAQASVGRIVMEGHRASQVIESIRAMFKQAPQTRGALDANHLIREVLAFTQAEIQRHRAAVQTDLAEALPPLMADYIQLQQVIRNLIMNALEAMDVVTDRPRVLTKKSMARDAERVLISVQESGPGIDPQDLPRIFDGFFTTKQHGMGMGLAICQSIVQTHGGRLSALPGQPHGTIFEVFLPAELSSV